jgi:hypothetical protein
MNNAGKGMIGCGALLLGLCGLAVLFFGFHVFIDPRGGISDDEAMPGFLGGILCGFVNFLVVAVGIFLATRKTEGATGGGAPGMPGMASAPGVPSQPAKPFPMHFVSGCGALLLLTLSCVPLGVGAMFWTDADRYDRYAEEDRRAGRDDPYFGASHYERRAEEYRNYTAGGCCCASFLLLLGLGAIGGTVRLAQKHRAAVGG